MLCVNNALEEGGYIFLLMHSEEAGFISFFSKCNVYTVFVVPFEGSRYRNFFVYRPDITMMAD